MGLREEAAAVGPLAVLQVEDTRGVGPLGVADGLLVEEVDLQREAAGLRAADLRVGLRVVVAHLAEDLLVGLRAEAVDRQVGDHRVDPQEVEDLLEDRLVEAKVLAGVRLSPGSSRGCRSPRRGLRTRRAGWTGRVRWA